MNARKIWIFGLVMAVALAAQVRGATVTATVDPADISLGDSTQLTVTVSGGASQPTVPQIPGLEIQAGTQSTSFSFNSNGTSSTTTSQSIITYNVTPQHAGTFTIPALESDNAKSQILTIHVAAGPGGATQAQNSPGAGPVVMPPPQNANPAAQAPEVGVGRIGTMEISLPKKEFYDGELAPIEIRALISGEVNVDRVEMPVFTSDGFTLNTLGKPEQTQRYIDGRPFYVLTWRSAVTAVKPGLFTLHIEMPMSLIVRQQMPSVNDPDAMQAFMRNAFAAMQGVRKDVKIPGTSEPLTVLPLPTAGRPANFSGAVGLFEAESSASPTRVNAGDPVTLTYAITGHGNFDRVSSSVLSGDANWKTYSPKVKFDAQDGVGYAGTKTFEQPVIPTNGSLTEVPALSFSYFDPDRKDYETCTTAPIPISVSGAPGATAPPVNAPAPNASVAAAPPAPVQTGPDLRINRIEAGGSVATLEPLYLSPVFMAAQALPLVALLGGLAFLRHRRSALAPDRARLSAAQQAIRQQVAAMDAAMADEQAGPFFVHARNALQQRYGPLWNIRPEAITVSDLDARRGEAGANARTVFEMADQAMYSDLNIAAADLQQWRQVVVSELAETKK